MIAALQEEFDDFAETESIIYYHVACPYYEGDKRCHCNNKVRGRETCLECKQEWLDMEIGRTR